MGPLRRLMMLLRREAPAQAEAAREALLRSAASGREAAVIGSAELPVGGQVVLGEAGRVMPSRMDREAALIMDPTRAHVFDFHTHPAQGMPEAPERFGVRPSREFDVPMWRDQYGGALGGRGRELRTVIAQPPSRSNRTGTGYSFFATDKPLAVFDPRGMDAARKELQYASGRGRFGTVKDEPAFRDYFDYGGELSDLVEDLAPLLYLRHKAAQGLGRQELQLTGRTLTPDPAATEQRFFRLVEPEALELLKAKKLARGGLAQVKECRCHG